MNTRKIAGLIAAAFCVSTAAFAQSDSRPASEQKSQVSANSTMTVVGCLMKESDYRRAHNLGKGALGGLGLGDEFVLVDATEVATTSAAETTSEPARPAASPSSTAATCRESGTGKAYRMTGKAENDLKPFVGHRLQVTGQFDHERDARTAAGETNAKLPPEIKIASYREAPAFAGQRATSSSPAPVAQSVPPAQDQVASNQPSNERRLPNTASNLPLVALVGFVCLIAALGLRFGRFTVS
jgi:hypothetical protein